MRDLAQSVAWYRDLLGFTLAREFERGGALMAVRLTAGDVQLLLTQDDGRQGLDRVKGAGCSFQFTTDQSIDALAERLQQAGVPLATAPTTAPWGARMFRVHDPDGFLLVFSTG